jgi:hypothetical protein
MRFVEALAELINASIRSGVSVPEIVFSLEVTKSGMLAQIVREAPVQKDEPRIVIPK